MTNETDRTKSDNSPESTWGATAEAKAAWERKYGAAARKSVKEAAAPEPKE